MSLSTSNKHKCLLVTHDAINFSPTKQRFSFSRDQRFKSISGTTPTPSEFTHTLPGTFGRRSPSFGVGDRFNKKVKQSKFRAQIPALLLPFQSSASKFLSFALREQPKVWLKSQSIGQALSELLFGQLIKACYPDLALREIDLPFSDLC